MNPPQRRERGTRDDSETKADTTDHEIMGKADLVLKAIDNPVDDYPERSLKEATKGVVSFNPGHPDHQTLRVEHSPDYVEKTPAGYISPVYAGAK